MTTESCIAPHEIEAGDLLAYLEGEETMEIVAHVARCRFCQQELVDLERMMDLFVAAHEEEEKGNGE